MLAVLRWAENPADRVTGFRVLQMLDGIGPATAAKVLDRMAGRDADRRARDLRAAGQGDCSPGATLVALMQPLTSRQAAWPAEFDLVRQWYQPHLEQRYADAVVRAGDLDQLQRIAPATRRARRFSPT